MADTNTSSTKTSGRDVIVLLARRLLGRRSGNLGDVVAGAVLEFIGIILGVAGPFMLKLVVDALSAGAIMPLTLIIYVGMFVFTWSGANIVSTWRMVYSGRVVDRMTGQLVVNALRARLPAAASGRDGDSSQTLGLVERLPYSLTVVIDGLIWRVAPLLVQVIGSLWLISGLIPFHYALIMAVVLASYAFATWLGAVRHQSHSTGANLAAAAVSQNTGDILRNARRVVLNGALDIEIAHIADRYRAKQQANQQMIWSLMTMSAFQYGLVGLGLLLLLALGGADVISGQMTVGNFVLLQACAFRLVMPLSGFGFILSQAAISIANISDVLRLSDDSALAKEIAPAIDGPAAISLDDVSFTYGPGMPGVSNVGAEIAAGSFVVIVGPNGSGKSTLAQLIAGILDPSAGAVRVNGDDLSKVSRNDRHRYILYVPQFIGLFNRTLGANALYPPANQTEGDLARLLGDWHFYEADREIDFGVMVGEQGERLSGGQIQKLELARIAGIKVPAIILDESTSSLDPVSEDNIVASLRMRFGAATTLILITHRLRVAEAADQVLFMKGGRLVRHGPHEVLMRDSAAYARLWQTRAGEDSSQF